MRLGLLPGHRLHGPSPDDSGRESSRMCAVSSLWAHLPINHTTTPEPHRTPWGRSHDSPPLKEELTEAQGSVAGQGPTRMRAGGNPRLLGGGFWLVPASSCCGAKVLT